jgi:hypothetical protein
MVIKQQLNQNITKQKVDAYIKNNIIERLIPAQPWARIDKCLIPTHHDQN